MQVTFNEKELRIIGKNLINAPWIEVVEIFEKISEALDVETSSKEQKQEDKKVFTSDAPYGYKKDGTPKKRPGRQPA